MSSKNFAEDYCVYAAIEAARTVCSDAAWITWADQWLFEEDYPPPKGLAVTALPAAARLACQAALTLIAMKKATGSALKIYKWKVKEIAAEAIQAVADMEKACGI